MIVLSEVGIDASLLNKEIHVLPVDRNTIGKYSGNGEVRAIVCSRAIAALAPGLDFPALALVNLTSAGYDGVPVGEFKKRGVLVANAGSVYSIPIAETVVFGMLLMAKKLRKNPNNRFFRITRKYNQYISELAGKRVMILGTGNIGTEVAKRLTGFDMRILGFDKFVSEKSPFDQIVSTVDALKEALPGCRYVVSTLPDTDDTRGLINNELLSCMGRDCVLVNVGRTAVLDKEALFMALKTKAISGAVLDMFEKLPNPVTNRFRRLGNVIVFPGVAAISKDTNCRLQSHLAHNLNCVNSGQTPASIINTEA